MYSMPISRQSARQYLAAFPASEPQVRKKYILPGPVSFALLSSASTDAGSRQPCVGAATTQGRSDVNTAGPPCFITSFKDTSSSPVAAAMILAAYRLFPVPEKQSIIVSPPVS